jgi:mono/diheme cytochrome c family protein
MKTNRSHLPSASVVILALAALLALDASWVLAQTENSPSAKDAKTYAALTKVPEKARGRRNPLESDNDAVAAGGKLFEQHCAECHGMKAEGTNRAPSLLKPEVQQASPGAIFWISTNGVVRHGMPVWSKLPEPQRWQIVAFLKSFRASSISPASMVTH